MKKNARTYLLATTLMVTSVCGSDDLAKSLQMEWRYEGCFILGSVVLSAMYGLRQVYRDNKADTLRTYRRGHKYRQEQEAFQLREGHINDWRKKVDIFPGTLEEYCSLKKCPHEILDTGNLEKSMVYLQHHPGYRNRTLPLAGQLELVERMKNNGCTAFIHAKESVYRWYGDFNTIYTGVPVRKKE